MIQRTTGCCCCGCLGGSRRSGTVTVAMMLVSIVGLALMPCLAGVALADRPIGKERTRRLQNVSQTIEELLKGYDIRLRPQFGGECCSWCSNNNEVETRNGMCYICIVLYCFVLYCMFFNFAVDKPQ